MSGLHHISDLVTAVATLVGSTAGLMKVWRWRRYHRHGVDRRKR
jgi:hypothetical protein